MYGSKARVARSERISCVPSKREVPRGRCLQGDSPSPMSDLHPAERIKDDALTETIASFLEHRLDLLILVDSGIDGSRNRLWMIAIDTSMFG